MEQSTEQHIVTQTPLPPRNLLPKAIGIFLIIIGALALLVCVFQIGTIVGARRAQFVCRWNNNYGPLFHVSIPAPRPPMNVHGPRLPDANGASGIVLQINGNELIVKSRDGLEKNILISTSTAIRKALDQIQFNQIKLDDHLVIFGAPTDQGQIQAKFIRVLPEN